MASTDRRGYQGFGSFFSGNVQTLIGLSDEEWAAPEVPPAVAQALREVSATHFGLPAREHFFIDFEAFTFLNHGAFGSPLRACYAVVRAWQEYCEAQPLRFLDRQLFPYVVRVLRAVAGFVNAQPDELAFIPNATTGINTVLANTDLSAGDEVLMLDIGYGAVKTVAQVRCGQCGATLRQARVPLPIRSSADLEEPLIAATSDRTRLIILDAVTSNTAIKLPLVQLIQAVKKRCPHARVLVDAAHALGQLPVDLAALGADYWVSNCHKWLCGPRGSAVLWVSHAAQAEFRPLVLSHGFGHGFTSDFIWDGCRDYACYLGVEAALQWWETNDADAIRRYSHELVADAAGELVSAWGTDLLAPLDMCASMACVRLPTELFGGARGCATSADAKLAQDLLYEHRVEVPIKCLGGDLYVRLSAHVYNDIGDYQQLKRVVQEVKPGLGEKAEVV